jgi:hypothetical protein
MAPSSASSNGRESLVSDKSPQQPEIEPETEAQAIKSKLDEEREAERRAPGADDPEDDARQHVADLAPIRRAPRCVSRNAMLAPTE